MNGVADIEAKALSTEFKAKTEKQVFDDLQREYALDNGTLSLDQINRMVNFGRTGAAIKVEHAQKSKKSGIDAFWNALLLNMNNQLDWLDKQIEGHREYFQNKYGDEWRTVLGKSILDEDEFPERLPGETDEEYNQRLEDAMFDKIANPDGTLKDEYKDHPDADRLALWAKDRHAREKVAGFINEHHEAKTDAERIDIAERATSDATTRETEQFMAGGRLEAGSASEQVAQANRDEVGDAEFQKADLSDRSGDFFQPT